MKRHKPTTRTNLDPVTGEYVTIVLDDCEHQFTLIRNALDHAGQQLSGGNLERCLARVAGYLVRMRRHTDGE